MRNQWRLLLLRCHPSRSPHHNRHFQVVSTTPTFHSFSSLLHTPTTPPIPPEVPKKPLFQNLSFRFFSSSEPALENKDNPDQVVTLTDIFSQVGISDDEIKLELESNNVVVTHDLVLSVLQNPSTTPDVARRLFDWVSEVDGRILSSKSYNYMLGLLGVNGFVKEFWDLVGVMKKKGYGVARGTCIRVSEKFEAEDRNKLVELYANGSTGNSIENLCSRICKVIRQDVWGDEVEKQLSELNVEFTCELVEMVLESIASEPNKALILFRWIEETGLFKHDERTYNAIARVLCREDCTEKFWRVMHEMRSAGCELVWGTYILVMNRFLKRKLLKDAVDLYEYAMEGAVKQDAQDCTIILKKIVVAKEIDMNLFSRVLRVYMEGGNVLTNSTLDSVLKSLTSVRRFGECYKILKAMEEHGLIVSRASQCRIAFQLSSNGRMDEVREFINSIEASGSSENCQTWASLVEGYCVAGHLDEASDCFQKMVDKEGTSRAGYAFEMLVTAYCRKNRAVELFKLLLDMVNERKLILWHSTYKLLISKLLVQGGLKEALNLVVLMKNSGYPPFLDPFLEYISKSGTADDACMFLKTVSVRNFPSTSVYLRVFEAYFKTGRRNEAQDFLSKCPGYIRNHADVLTLFCPVKSSGGAAATSDVSALD
ncbi:hypothetical protein RJ639_012208 [Escallonia herrerae]|uniref:Pentatricopeptide repeat-containing protein n=1 Tax=Escallonia herrerae TaxID=1293975 RepID=A0AA88VL15_9ASTE|nr:hypothetical protein RJ639_012208 [Escallonia herrerae]